MKRLAVVLMLLCMCTTAYAREWQGIVVHHSATETGTVESIRRYHINHNGWDDIGYHYVIYRNGEVHEGRDLDTIGAHARTGRSYSRNSTHIGICLIGVDDFTAAQIKALKQLVVELDLPAERHHSQCPSSGVPDSFFGNN